MEQTPVLLLSSSAPGEAGVGGQMLGDLLHASPGLRVTPVVERPFMMGRNFPRAPFLDRVSKAAFARLGTAQAWRLSWFRRRELRRRAATVVDKAKEMGTQCIWLTTSTPELIWIGAALGRQGYDIRAMVWDDPAYLAQNLRLPAAERRLVGDGFAELLQMANRVSVVSHAMADRYQAFLRSEPLIIRHGVQIDEPVEKTKVGKRPVRMVFAGSLYSKVEWNALLAALDRCDWRIGQHFVELNFVGTFPLEGATRSPRVNMLGQQSFERTMEIMANMDIGYLPYWFSEARELVARTSFPGKMSSYAAAGLAIFHHAPAYTEATRFLSEYPFGVCCPSLDPDEIIARLEATISLSPTQECRLARREAVAQELSAKAMAHRVEEFLAPERSLRENNP